MEDGELDSEERDLAVGPLVQVCTRLHLAVTVMRDDQLEMHILAA